MPTDVVLNPTDTNTAGTDQNAPVDPNSNVNRDDTSRVGNDGKTPVADKTYSFKEDRSDWVPRHRLSEVEKRAAEKAVKDIETRHKVELEARDKKLRILAGVEQVDPQQAEDAKVKAELSRILGPGIEKLTPEFLAKLEAAVEAASGAQGAALKVWEDHAESLISTIETDLADMLGADALTPTQSRAVRRAYRDAAEEAAWARQNDPNHDSRNDFIARHERSDKALLKEFVDSFAKDWIEPVRRKVTSDATNRFRPVPRGERGRPMTGSTPKKIDFSKPGAMEDALAAARSEEGRGYREQ